MEFEFNSKAHAENVKTDKSESAVYAGVPHEYLLSGTLENLESHKYDIVIATPLQSTRR